VKTNDAAIGEKKLLLRPPVSAGEVQIGAHPSNDVVERRARRERVLHSLKPERRSSFVPISLIALLIAGIGVGGYLVGTPDGRGQPNCDLPPGPAVNWSSCAKQTSQLAKADLSGAILRSTSLINAELMNAHLRSADLAYADLSGAHLGYADLEGSVLTGANLRGSDFAYANLRAADFSFADLREAVLGGADLEGTRFDNAIWLDGRICKPGSVGGWL
jgi:uncharacterized protein YjbI with pentapeptide repeats